MAPTMVGYMELCRKRILYTICAWIFCVVPMGQAYVTYGATQGLPVLVYSESDFRLYTRIVLFAAGRDGLVSVTLNIVRNMDIFGMLSLTSYPKHIYSNPTITKQYRSFFFFSFFGYFLSVNELQITHFDLGTFFFKYDL